MKRVQITEVPVGADMATAKAGVFLMLALFVLAIGIKVADSAANRAMASSAASEATGVLTRIPGVRL